MLEELVAGVVSSVLAVLLVELYFLLRRFYQRRSLREVLNHSKRVTLVAPIFPYPAEINTVSLMSTHDAYAIAHIIDAYRRIGVEPSVTSSGRLPDGLDTDLVCIGGFISNELTRSHLDVYCRKFEFFEAPTARSAAAPNTGEVAVGSSAYRCGGHEFIDTAEIAWGFLVKLGPELTGSLHSVILVWGLGALGTSAAAYFLSDLHKQVQGRGRDSFFLAVPVQRSVGYKGVRARAVDLSDDVWGGEPVPAPVRRKAVEPA